MELSQELQVHQPQCELSPLSSERGGGRKDNYNSQDLTTNLTPQTTTRMASGQGPGLHVNGDVVREGEDSSHHMVSDDMLYKLSKKIAQLTKVIYSLNTKNDDLEFDMENMRHGYEDKLEKVSLMPRHLIPLLYM